MSQLIINAKNSKHLKVLITGALENQLKLIKLGISKTEKILREFENRFKMPSDQFFNLYQNGRFGDESDYMKWAGEIETLNRLKSEMTELLEVEIC